MPTCDCGATPEDVTAGIHGPDCISHTGTPDDPSDHYDKPRLLNHWNATRHGRNHFQQATRKAAERLARKPYDTDSQ